ncbi:hypothetical protein BGZ70_001431 [Mortierella alpina]|uniref:Uncharacterized protein n=1 Tax=Mortierella alpina TaxID=64518 RepID=A0A9P6LXZ2_MORAP|nr:hypothetical protein BGZ70_001431 [Mortierella alpina]
MTQDSPDTHGVQRFRMGIVVKDFEPIEPDLPGEKSFVFLEDVQYAFNTDAARFEIGTMAVPFMRDPTHRKYIPERIACRPGVIIDMVHKLGATASTALPQLITELSPAPASEPDPASEPAPEPTPKPAPSHSPSSAPPLPPSTVALTSTHLATLSLVESPAFNEPTPSIIEPLLQESKCDASSDIPGQSMSQLSIEKATTVTTPPIDTDDKDATEVLFEGYVLSRLVHLVGKTDTMLRLQQETLDRLAIVQIKAEAILTQNFELLEYTIPRLFVILPDTTASRWDPSNLLGARFRLHFICECGDHTRTATSRIPHHLHLAKHDGYEIQEPKEFFTKYIGFLTIMLEILKFGLNVAGYMVPALSTLSLSQSGDAANGLKDGNGKNLVEGVDRSILFLEQFRANNQDSLAQVGGNDAVSTLGGGSELLEGLEGVDLRQLATYLKVGDSANLLGNLYRMTTKEGHVKWVCRDHYRAGYQEASYQKLHGIVNAAGGVFDEQLGKITVTIKSGIAAAQLYDAIGTTRGIHELEFTMAWDQDNEDLVKLKDMIKKSSIMALTLDLQYKTGTKRAGFSLSGTKRYDPIWATVQLSSVTAVHIVNAPKDFFKQSNLVKAQVYAGLRTIHVGDHFKDWSAMTEFLRRSPNIERVLLKAFGDKLASQCFWFSHSRTEQHRRPLTVQFGDSPDHVWFQLTFPPGKGVFFLRQAEFISQHGGNIEVLGLQKYMDNELAIILAEATRMKSRLFNLNLAGFTFDQQGSQAIGKVISQSPLVQLNVDIHHEYDFGLLATLPWETLQSLRINNHVPSNLLTCIETVHTGIETYLKAGKKSVLDRLLYRCVGFSKDSVVAVGSLLSAAFGGMVLLDALSAPTATVENDLDREPQVDDEGCTGDIEYGAGKTVFGVLGDEECTLDAESGCNDEG